MDAIDTIDYRGYKIEIHPDMHPVNPFEFGDTEPPILVSMENNDRTSEHGHDRLDDTAPYLSDDDIAAHWPEMLSDLDYGSHWGDANRFARDEVVGTGKSFYEALRDEYDEYVSGLRVTERLEAIAAIHRWQGNPAVVKTIRGFCQGDFGTVLAVATKEWRDRVGVPDESAERQAELAINLFENYAFGSVYGYIVTATADEDEDDDSEGDNEIESCWGFHGMDHEASGLLDMARSEIDGLCDAETTPVTAQAA